MNLRRRAAVSLIAAGLAAGLIGGSLAVAAPQSKPSRSAAIAANAQPAQPIGHAGRWFTDARGRVLIVHGVNVSMKGTTAQSQAYKLGADDAAFLASKGLNAIRLTVERHNIAPKPDKFDTSYLRLVRQIVRTFDRYGVMTLIDFHQDEFGPVFHDNGYPAWMTRTGGQPNLYQVGFPFQYLLNPALNQAFDTLWRNGNDVRGRPLWDDDAEIIQRTVKSLAKTPGVLGFEIINEPWPGTQYPNCLVPLVGCPSFDQGPLSSYYARMTAAIRAKDTERLVFYEPLVTFDYGIPTSVTPPNDPRLAFAFHDYPLCTFGYNAALPLDFDAECGVESRLALSNALAHVAEHPNALINDEFGAAAPPRSIRKSVGLYDTQMVPWMFWSYQELVGITASGAYPAPPGKAPFAGVVDALTRAYPQLISGTPQSWGYDPITRVMAATYSTARAGGSGRFPHNAVSQFATPRSVYPRGYDVAVTGGHVVSGRTSPQLLVAASPGAKRVTVKVTPATD